MVSPLARAGGAERAFASLARNLPSFGLDPVVALLEPGPLEDWLGDHYELIDARPERPLRLDQTARTVRRLARLARASGARAILSSKTRGHLYGGPAALAARLPAIWWSHEMPPRGLLYRRREPWRSYGVEEPARGIPAAAVVVGNERVAERQRRRTPHREITTIRPGLPVAEVAARRGEGRELRRRLGLEGVPLVGIVARLDRVKGHGLFLEAAARVASVRPDVRFPVVGGESMAVDCGYADELRGRAAALGLGDSVLFTGHADDAIPWLDALDVAVISSVSEAGPLVLGEAMALGRPVVATAAPGAGDVIEDGHTGLLVPPGDPAAMAGAILRVLGDPGLAERLGRGGREHAGEFCERRMAARFAELVTEVVG
jgi:glycosyltransferase involved in cell wall biosynthesis